MGAKGSPGAAGWGVSLRSPEKSQCPRTREKDQKYSNQNQKSSVDPYGDAELKKLFKNPKNHGPERGQDQADKDCFPATEGQDHRRYSGAKYSTMNCVPKARAMDINIADPSHALIRWRKSTFCVMMITSRPVPM